MMNHSSSSSSTMSISQQLLYQLGRNNNGTLTSVTTTSTKSVNRNIDVNQNNSINNSLYRRHYHDPCIALASHIIYTLFGPIVQQVVDCIQCRGSVTLREITSYLAVSVDPINSSKRKNDNNDSSSLALLSSTIIGGMNDNVGAAADLTISQIKAALIILLQHSIVTTKLKQQQQRPVGAKSSTHNTDTSKNKCTLLSSPSLSKRKSIPRTITIVFYQYHPTTVLYMMHRYTKFSEYIRKSNLASPPPAATVSSTTVTSSLLTRNYSHVVIEELLLYGRLSTIDLIYSTVQRANQLDAESSESSSSSDLPQQDKLQQQQKLYQIIIDTFAQLVTSGFIVLASSSSLDGNDNREYEWRDDTIVENFNTSNHPNNKRIKLNDGSGATTGTKVGHVTLPSSSSYQDAAQSIATMLVQLSGAPMNSSTILLPLTNVWTIHTAIFHEHLRAYYFGKYISERYGGNSSNTSCIGSLITAALKYRAYKSHYNKIVTNDSTPVTTTSTNVAGYFTVLDIIKYIPKSVLQMIEKKIGQGNNNNTIETYIQQIFTDVCRMGYHPPFLRRVDYVDENYTDSRQHQQKPIIIFEVLLSTISKDYINRIIYQIVYDRHGPIAARVTSILLHKGYLEADRLAEMAMVPAKDTREVLHHLYRSRYIELLQLSNNSSRQQQYNPSNAIYLWGVERERLLQRMTNDVMRAMYNIRLRRQHEVEVVGSKYIDQITTTTNDTNETSDLENDINYKKFCIGLERLDVASIQLDETLMALSDFSKIVV